MKLQWPLVREKRDATGLVAGEASHRREEEAFTKIEGTEHLSNRIRYEDESLVAIINHLVEEQKMLLSKDKLTDEDKKVLEDLRAQIIIWEQYRATRKAAVAWSAAGENRDMSERYSAYETFFSRNWQKPWMANIIMRMSAYLRSIGYQEWHATPAPTVMVDKQILIAGRQQGLDPNAIATAGKQQTVARAKD